MTDVVVTPTQYTVAIEPLTFIVRVGTTGGGGGGTGDVIGPSGAVSGNIAIYNGVTGKLIGDSGVSTAAIPSSLPVPIAEGGTGQVTAGAALTALGGDAAGTPRPPTAHAASHLSTGADSIAEFAGATGVADGLDGLVVKPVAGQESLFLRGDATWTAPPTGGDVTGPAGAVSGNLATYDGVTGKLIQDAGINTSAIPSSLPVPIAEGGTGQITAGAALTGLGGDAAGTPRPPTAHAASHLSTGADSIAEFAGATGVADGLDGLVVKPVAGQEGLFLRGDATWTAPPTGGDVTGPAGAVSGNIASYDGVTGKLIGDSGINTSAIPSSLPVPIAEGGTGQITAGAALTALGGDAAGTPRPPTAHAASHLSTGADSIAEFAGATGVADGLDGLVVKPVAGQESLFLRGDATWAASAGITAVSAGRTLFVDAVYGNNGTAAPEDYTKPYLTVGAALAASSAGDCVEVRPGAYPEEGLVLPSQVALISAAGWQVTEIGLHAAVANIITVNDQATIEGIAFRIPALAGLSAVRYGGGGTPTFSIYNCNFYGDGLVGSGDGIFKTGAGKIIGAEIRGDIGGYNALLRVDSGVLALESIHVPASLGTIQAVALSEGTGRFQLVDLNVGAPSVVDAVYIDGTSTCIVFGINTFDCTNSIHIASDGVTAQILGGKMDQVGFSIIVDPALTGAGSVFRITANHQPEYSYPPAATGADFGFLFFQEATDVRDSLQRSFGADIHFGFPEKGSKLITGRGGPYATGMVVYTTDNTASPASDGANFIDVTAAAQSKTGSTFGFQGPGAGHSIVWTSQRVDAAGAYLRTFGLQVVQDVAAIVGAGNFVFEIQTAISTWTTVSVMAVSTAENYAYANNVFLRAASTEMVHLEIGSSSPVWPQTVVNGTSGRWARVRIDSTVTTAPTFETFRLASSAMSFNRDGQRLATGLAMWSTVVTTSGIQWSGSGTKNGAVTVGTGAGTWNHELDKGKLDSAGDDGYTQLILPANICTAFPLYMRILYGYQALGLTPPTLQLGTYVAEVAGNKIADPLGAIIPIDRSVAATELTTARVAALQALPGDTLQLDTIFRIEYGPIEIENNYGGDMVLMRFTMTADGTGTDVLLYGFEIEGVAMTDGQSRA